MLEITLTKDENLELEEYGLVEKDGYVIVYDHKTDSYCITKPVKGAWKLHL